MAVLLTFVLGIIIFSLFVLYSKTRRPAYLPPGPPTIPFIGNLNLDQNNLLKSFRIFRREYGEVYSLILGARTVVVVNGTDALRELLVKNADTTSERPDIFAFTEISQRSGLIGGSGHAWKEQRTFALNALREFGFGKRSIESGILEEVEVLLENVKEKNGQPFDIYNLLHVSISNVMCAIIFGKRFDHKDERFLGLLKCMGENVANPAIIGLATFLPIVKSIPFDPFKIKRTLRNVDKVISYINELVVDHKATYDENDIRDFLDAYLRKIYSDTTENSGFTEKELLMVIGDLFLAGTETTATALRWFILFCIRNPEIQEKMRNEIKNVIGESRLPKLEDRQKLPFSEAVLQETLRCGNITPLGVPHGLTCDINFRGYTIPQDTVIFPNLDSVLNDPDVFPDPEKFDPTRFLDEDGNLNGQDKILPFSLGRRVCLGESLARMELFLFATSLIQRFQFLPEKDDVLPENEGILGAARTPKSFRFRALQIC